MTRRYPVSLAAAIVLLLAADAVVAQEVRSLALTEGSKLVIDGTSNQSDWSVDVTQMEGAVWLSEDDGSFRPDSVFFKAPGAEMKSGKSPIMDRLMHRALKVTEHPDIVYTLGPAGIQDGEPSDTTFWHTLGSLELAGVSDSLYSIVSGYKDGDRYVFKGAHRMSMRQHDITPPTAMFGALHTSEWVTIAFELVFGE